jgi:hypothetical protein
MSPCPCCCSQDFVDTLATLRDSCDKIVQVVSFSSNVASELQELLGPPLDLSDAFRVMP